MRDLEYRQELVPLHYSIQSLTLREPLQYHQENGTGLGLATSFKITEAHNAKIHIDSSSKRTKFIISFSLVPWQLVLIPNYLPYINIKTDYGR